VEHDRVDHTESWRLQGTGRSSSVTNRRKAAVEQSKPTQAEDPYDLEPKTKDFEFGGPIGTGILSVVVPLVVLLVTHEDGWSFPWISVPLLGIEREGGFPNILSDPVGYVWATWDWTAFAVVAGWWCLHAVLHLLLPGETILGAKLRNGKQLAYKTNGLLCNSLAVLAVAAWHISAQSSGSPSPLAALADARWINKLAFATIVICIVKSMWLYWRSFRGGVMLAEPGNSGNVVYDFWMGRELNPRIAVPGLGEIDLKYFNELRPGMSAWLLLSWAPVVLRLEAFARGEASSMRWDMLIIAVLQAVYIFDSVVNESAILTTIDIISDGFGFMLCAGDLAWVPFTFSLQTRFLATKSVGLSWSPLAVAATVGLLGFSIFRLSNSQKDAFKRGELTDLPTIPPRSQPPREGGKRLLAGGWWAMARHVNYLGDWLLGLSWCLLTGFDNMVPYLYSVYFAVLLVHRERRDDHKCALKYGEDWEEYRRRVPWRIIPGLY
jgi:Delta14-sterol reductase